MEKDTKHIKDKSTDTEGYLEYTKEKEKGKVNQFDWWEHKDQLSSIGSYNPQTSKTKQKLTKPGDQQTKQVIKS